MTEEEQNAWMNQLMDEVIDKFQKPKKKIMTEEEFLRRKQYIKDICLRSLQILSEEYATSNNLVKIGDVLTSTISNMMVVENITCIYPLDALPYCSYHGSWLTKKGEQRHKKLLMRMSQCNIKAINGVGV